jgi:hypothetical protein
MIVGTSTVLIPVSEPTILLSERPFLPKEHISFSKGERAVTDHLSGLTYKEKVKP